MASTTVAGPGAGAEATSVSRTDAAVSRAVEALFGRDSANGLDTLVGLEHASTVSGHAQLSGSEHAPVLCDGAMGTMLYDRGVFINRCFDELNLSQSDLVLGIHADYLQAGAQVIETNTFGANAVRLERFGLADKVEEINRAGIQLARQAVRQIAEKQSAEAYVAGALGPLGGGLDAAGPLTPEAAQAAFAEQIRALAEGGPGVGADLLIAETMTSLAEAEQVVNAARDEAPELPLIVMITVDESGNCLDGTTAEDVAIQLTELGVAGIGCNCSAGPAVVLEVIERMRAVTDLPLAAMPNAGVPQSVEGRHIYMATPEYMASYARKFVKAGARFIGGCCGTTPGHIRSMRSALRALEAQQAGERSAFLTPEDQAGSGKLAADVGDPESRAEQRLEPAPLRERSKIGRMIADGEFVTLVEIVPPRGIDCSKELAGAAMLFRLGIDAVNVPDSPRASARMSAQSLCLQIMQKVGIETILHYTCRDRNVLSIQSDLLGSSSLGLRNILCLTGDPPKLGNYPDATAVFDVDAIGLVKIAKKLNEGLDIGSNFIGESTGFTLSVAANPGVADIDHEVRRFAAKVAAGAEFCITQPVFDLRLLEQFLRRVESFRIPVVAGIWPLTSRKNAEFMKNDLKVSMPVEILDRMSAAPTPDAARAEGVKIAREMLAQVRSYAHLGIQGVQVSAPFGKYHAAAAVLGLEDGIIAEAAAEQK